jgi:transcriptional regulator with XRE-family HTH domain
MSTTPKARKGKTMMTSEIIGKIDELRGLGMSASKIAGYLNLSESTVSRYARVNEAIADGKDFCIAGDLNEKAIRNYCIKLGIDKDDIPVNTYTGPANGKETDSVQVQMFHVMDRVRVVAVANMLNDLAGTLSAAVSQIQMLANYLDNSTKEELQ